MDSARMAINDDNDAEFGAQLMRKAFVNGRNDQARALNLMNVIRGLFIGRSDLEELERVIESGRVDHLMSSIRRDDHKLDTAKFILDTMRANIKLNNSQQASTTTTNKRVVNFLLKLFQIINDNLSPLADADELEHSGQMIVFYLELIKWDDIQERLAFYTRCRSCVGNLHVVLEHLIRRVLELPGAHKQIERKRGARQNFLNACLAFALATIPAFYNKLELQLELSRQALELALKRSSLSLANYYVKHVISTLQFLPSELSTSKASLTETDLERCLASILALVIEHQDHIDLKHKLTLAKLITKKTFPMASESLLQSLKHLNCIELLAQDNDAGRGSVNSTGDNDDDDDDGSN